MEKMLYDQNRERYYFHEKREVESRLLAQKLLHMTKSYMIFCYCKFESISSGLSWKLVFRTCLQRKRLCFILIFADVQLLTFRLGKKITNIIGMR